MRTKPAVWRFLSTAPGWRPAVGSWRDMPEGGVDALPKPEELEDHTVIEIAYTDDGETYIDQLTKNEQKLMDSVFEAFFIVGATLNVPLDADEDAMLAGEAFAKWIIKSRH